MSSKTVKLLTGKQFVKAIDDGVIQVRFDQDDFGGMLVEVVGEGDVVYDRFNEGDIEEMCKAYVINRNAGMARVSPLEE